MMEIALIVRQSQCCRLFLSYCNISNYSGQLNHCSLLPLFVLNGKLDQKIHEIKTDTNITSFG